MLKLFQLWCYTSFILQVICYYSPYYEVQYPLPYSNDILLQHCRNYRSYPTYTHFNSAPKELNNHFYYDRHYYNPSSIYKHQCSYIKCTPNPYRSVPANQYSLPLDTIHYYMNPSLQCPQTYANYMQKSEQRAKLHNYVPYYHIPSTNYAYRSQSINKIDNTSIINTSGMYPKTNLAKQNYMWNPLYYYTDKNLPQLYNTDISTHKTLKNQLNEKESRENKVQFMFPSEIVIRSLGPWAPIGNSGEYRSNGTFSIKYDTSNQVVFKNQFSPTQNNFLDNNRNSNKKSADYLDERNVSFYNKTTDDSLLQISKDFTNEFVENSSIGENDLLKPLEGTSHLKKNEFVNGKNLKHRTKNTVPSRNKVNNLHFEELNGYQTNLTNVQEYKANIRKKNKLFSPWISINRGNLVKNSHLLYDDEKKINKLKSRRNHRTFKKKSSKRAFVSDNFGCTNISTTNAYKPISSTLKLRTTLEETISTLEGTLPTLKQTSTPPILNTRKTENETIFKTDSIATERISTVFPVNQRTEIKPLIASPNSALKSQCEHQNNVRCICSIRQVLQDMDQIISSNDESKGLFANLANYSCSRYVPINNAYKISADMKPRLISNKPKELLVDEGSGPKEILADTIDELMTRGIPNEGIDFYVFPSTNIEIPCITTNKIQLSPNTADSTKYTWNHGDQQLITEGRFLEDINHRGSLQITGVTMSDSDNYTCTVNYTDPDSELPASSSFLHTVLVVSEPLLALHSLIHYKAKAKCDQEMLEMFELYLPQQIERLICGNNETAKICNVEIHNPMCQTKNLQQINNAVGSKLMYNLARTQTRRARDINIGFEDYMIMSLNYQVDTADIWQFMPSTDNRTHCSPFCQQKVILKVIETLKESVSDALTYPVESSLGVVFEPDLSTLTVRTVIACTGGLQLYQGFCVPCPKEHYSEEGSTQCTKCPPGTYQNDIGAKICENCPHPFKEGCFAMWTTPIMLILLSGIMIIFILTICLLVYMCSANGGKIF
ncbi:uncharacterized protein isoform X3 [Rhodnius prolixus]|uniref:uncharacterized protein isoform X3 n=1 Tax=Rhodnius prolixus TaxID=13249 RepID=UPI003D18FA90